MNLMPAHPWVTIRNAIFEPDMWSLPTEIRHAATWEPWKRKRRSKTHKISVGTGTWRDFWSWNRRLNRRDGETLRVRGQRAVPQGRPGERVRQVGGHTRMISCDFHWWFRSSWAGLSIRFGGDWRVGFKQTKIGKRIVLSYLFGIQKRNIWLQPIGS